MSELQEFRKLIEEIESLLESYASSVELDPTKKTHEIFEERSKLSPILEKAIQLATEGLERYPFNAVLLRLRAIARCHVVTPDGKYTEIGLAEQDLRTVIEFDPDNLKACSELLDMLFTFSD